MAPSGNFAIRRRWIECIRSALLKGGFCTLESAGNGKIARLSSGETRFAPMADLRNMSPGSQRLAAARPIRIFRVRRADLAVSAISALCLALSFDIALADASASVGQPVPIAVVDFNYIDTSGEPQDQSAAHQKRLHALMLALRSELAEKGDYRLVPIECRPGPCSVARSN